MGVAHRLYGEWLRWRLRGLPLPRHLALIMDGNRRWARGEGYDDVRVGHRFGAEHLDQVLGWCTALGIRHVTVWVASADNIRKRDSAEVAFLMELAETVLAEQLIRSPDWRLHVAGTLDLLPDTTAIALKQAQERTRDRPGAADLTIAIGYSGRQEVTDAVRSWLTETAAAGRTLAEAAATLTERDISAHLYHPDLPEPDLVIRTSGEQRLSDFLLWQATRADVHFCDVYWPAFRYVDLLRVLRTFGVRAERRGETASPGRGAPDPRPRGQG